MSIIISAAQFARYAHRHQRRKYTGALYINHPARVAGRMAAHVYGNETNVAAAFLHDVLEDTNTTAEELLDFFGKDITQLVVELTNPSKGLELNRAKRKAIDREHIATISPEAKVIKLLDRIDNILELPTNTKFWEVYKQESLLLAKTIGNIDPLYDELMQLLNQPVLTVTM